MPDITVTLPDDLYADLQEIAHLLETTPTALLIRAVENTYKDIHLKRESASDDPFNPDDLSGWVGMSQYDALQTIHHALREFAMRVTMGLTLLQQHGATLSAQQKADALAAAQANMARLQRIIATSDALAQQWRTR